MQKGIVQSKNLIFEFMRQEEAQFGEYFFEEIGFDNDQKEGDDGEHSCRSKYLCPFFSGKG